MSTHVERTAASVASGRLIVGAIAGNQATFESTWIGLRPIEQLMLAAIAAVTDEQTALAEEQLTWLLVSLGAQVSDDERRLVLGRLSERALLRCTNDRYQVAIEPLRRWAAARTPLFELVEHLSRATARQRVPQSAGLPTRQPHARSPRMLLSSVGVVALVMLALLFAPGGWPSSRAPNNRHPACDGAPSAPAASQAAAGACA